ncbi:MAG: DUF4055 domain-containing protein [Alphaproteobacteria bacterium]|nr:DUF4055 domain-containing protein [Alphaproteobacteria bacterium]
MDHDPSIPCAGHLRMAGRWELPRALMGGTAIMRAAGQRWLPRHPAESERHYQTRLARTVLRNHFRRAVQTLVGKVFSRPLLLGPDVPAPLVAMMEDVDLTGRHLDVFARDVFADALVHGLSHVLVDYPAVAPGRTLAEERATGARPYAVHVRADQVIGWRAERVAGGVERLAQLRIRETAVEPDGRFGERAVERVRVLEPGRWQVWRPVSPDGAWAVVEEGRTSLAEIPLVTVYAERVGFMEAAPPLEDLAWLNLEHWQIRSDQRNALNVTSFPILAAAGWNRDGDGQVEFGPNKFLTTGDPAGRFYYVESGGAHLAAGRAELEALEEAMRLFGLQFETTHGGAATATGRAIDAAEGAAPLKAWARAMADALENMLVLFARWQGLGEDGGSVTTEPESGLPPGGGDVEALLAARQAGDLSRATLLGELKRRRVLADDVDPAGEAKAVADETAAAA